MDGLDVVPVRIQEICGVVVVGVRTQSRRAVAPVPGCDAGLVKRVDLSSRLGDEGEMDRLARCPLDERECAELGRILSSLFDAERREHGAVEHDARLEIADREIDVVEHG